MNVAVMSLPVPQQLIKISITKLAYETKVVTTQVQLIIVYRY